ncbi:hypothetical protein [Streptomyces fradiae]|uniref:hypothetical protein n=1 Tax=Streptomyces fradiae TaxID=1906 RepID=UPI002941DFCC|nr:hypothetical protein [Streptomyces fradiae]WOI58778.1 hypothetical protein RYQ63_01900 [Streptomyces fradiae]
MREIPEGGMKGPRAHEDWRTDVLAVKAPAVPDPRGRLVLRWDEEEIAADPGRGSSHPFTVAAEERLGEILQETAPELAAQLPVVMVDERFGVRSVPGLPERRKKPLADARTLLARHLPDGSASPAPPRRGWTRTPTSSGRSPAADPAPPGS